MHSSIIIVCLAQLMSILSSKASFLRTSTKRGEKKRDGIAKYVSNTLQLPFVCLLDIDNLVLMVTTRNLCVCCTRCVEYFEPVGNIRFSSVMLAISLLPSNLQLCTCVNVYFAFSARNKWRKKVKTSPLCDANVRSN